MISPIRSLIVDERIHPKKWTPPLECPTAGYGDEIGTCMQKNPCAPNGLVDQTGHQHIDNKREADVVSRLSKGVRGRCRATC